MKNGHRILVVDDERDIAQVASLRLRAAGYETMTANDGDTGIVTALKQAPDAIVMDIRMPRKNGLAALAELQARRETQHIPVIMLSASLVDQPAALDAGARFFLTKPYEAQTLLTAVQRAVDEASRR